MPTNAHWTVAEAVAVAVLERYPTQVHAIGVHGALAHGDESGIGGVDLVVVTYEPAADGPKPASRRIDGVIVDCGVVSVDEGLADAQTLSTAWPLTADRYLTTKPIFDPNGWHDRLRDTHLGRLAQADTAEFTALARQAWCPAAAWLAAAMDLAAARDTDSALLTLTEARLAAALVEGLLGRTYFRNAADAVRRTGLGEAGLTELDHRLTAQALELKRRGHPVDGTPADLFD